MRGALRYQSSADGNSAIQTWLPGALVDAVIQLKKSGAALRIHIVRNGRSAGGDRLLQNGHDRIIQSPGAVTAQSRSHGERVNARTKQRFIRINVADSAQ